MNDNKRKSTRLSVTLEIDAKETDGKKISGLCTDISAKGLFIQTTDIFPEGSRCLLELYLGDRRIKPAVACRARVVRAGAEGMGVEFLDFAFNSYQHLKNLILSGQDEPENLEGEFESPPS
ncbi:MAG: PilZ domain-containing protein [Candidatus Omnitrophica bacterium]|nr:PilZ domain-containing protein [Candidatus Omnitrophota bacterium]